MKEVHHQKCGTRHNGRRWDRQNPSPYDLAGNSPADRRQALDGANPYDSACNRVRRTYWYSGKSRAKQGYGSGALKQWPERAGSAEGP